MRTYVFTLPPGELNSRLSLRATHANVYASVFRHGFVERSSRVCRHRSGKVVLERFEKSVRLPLVLITLPLTEGLVLDNLRARRPAASSWVPGADRLDAAAPTGSSRSADNQSAHWVTDADAKASHQATERNADSAVIVVRSVNDFRLDFRRWSGQCSRPWRRGSRGCGCS